MDRSSNDMAWIRGGDDGIDFAAIADALGSARPDGAVEFGNVGAGALFDALPVAAFATSIDGRLTAYNAAAVELCGYRPEIGTMRWRLRTIEGAAMAFDASPIAIALAERRPVAGSQGTIERPDGTCVDFTAYCAPVFSRDGVMTGGIAILMRAGQGGKTEQTLLDSRAHQHKLVAHNPWMSWVADGEGRILEVGPQWVARLGIPPDHALGAGWADLLHPDDRDRTVIEWRRCFRTGQPLDIEYRMRVVEGGYRWFRSLSTRSQNDSGSLVRWYGNQEDCHDRKTAEIALRENEERYRYTIELSTQIPFTLEPDGTDMRLGRHWEGMTIPPAAPDLGELTDYLHPDHRKTSPAAWRHAIATGEALDDECRLLRADGGYRWYRIRAAARHDAEGAIVRWYGTIEDIEERHTAEAAIRWTATHDGLTRLPNRFIFQERVRIALEEAAANGRRLGLILLDLDHFKTVNDQLGHDAGDSMLRIVAERLREMLCDGRQAARLGGDEFALLIPDDGKGGIEANLEPLLAHLARPFRYDEQMQDCRASMGVAIFPLHGQNADELLKSADIALYDAKTAGGNRVRVFESAMRAEMQQRASMLSLARHAIENDLIEPYYQPKIDLATGRTIGVEALLRWHHPRLGLQSPDTILVAFEDAELALEIGDRMQDRIIADMRRWLDAGIEFGRVAINASAAEFRRENFAERLLARIAAAGIPASRFELEVTETVFLGRGSECVGRALMVLSEAGVSVALDDFGTGYASLSHLSQYPVDVLKIDRSFVKDLATRCEAAAIVRAVIQLGKAIGIRTVAEGIETEEQARALADAGCDFGQGYLYGRAAPADMVPPMMLG